MMTRKQRTSPVAAALNQEIGNILWRGQTADSTRRRGHRPRRTICAIATVAALALGGCGWLSHATVRLPWQRSTSTATTADTHAAPPRPLRLNPQRPLDAAVHSFTALRPLQTLFSHRAPVPAVMVLELHDVVPAALLKDPNLAKSEAVISAEELDRDFAFLVRYGFTAVDTQAIADFVSGRRTLPARSILITFDDGYESQFEYAFPLLRKYRLHATLFVVAGRISQVDMPFVPQRLSQLSWGQLRQMVASGLVDVQSHTYDMHGSADGRLQPLLTAPEPAITADLLKARETIEQNLGRPVFAFAYPHGRYNARVLTALHAAGYRLAFVGGSLPVTRSDNPLLLPRFFVFPQQGLYWLLRWFTPSVPTPHAHALPIVVGG